MQYIRAQIIGFYATVIIKRVCCVRWWECKFARFCTDFRQGTLFFLSAISGLLSLSWKARLHDRHTADRFGYSAYQTGQASFERGQRPDAGRQFCFLFRAVLLLDLSNVSHLFVAGRLRPGCYGSQGEQLVQDDWLGVGAALTWVDGGAATTRKHSILIDVAVVLS